MTAPAAPLTSVVMVSYHTGPVLTRAIASVLAQSEPVELCLVDNGNPPEVIETLRTMAGNDARIRFLTGHGNVGFSRGCNLGARAAQGDHLLFLNPDSVLPPDTLLKLQKHGATLKRPYMIGARLLGEDGHDQRGCRRALLTPGTAFVEALGLFRLFPRLRLNFNEEKVPAALAPMPAISGAFMYLPREDFFRIDGFDEGYFLHVEDMDLCLRFRRAGGEILFAPDIPVTHIGATSNAPSWFIEKHKARGFVRYFHKNFGGNYPLPLLWLVDAAAWVRACVRVWRAQRSG